MAGPPQESITGLPGKKRWCCWALWFPSRPTKGSPVTASLHGGLWPALGLQTLCCGAPPLPPWFSSFQCCGYKYQGFRRYQKLDSFLPAVCSQPGESLTPFIECCPRSLAFSWTSWSLLFSPQQALRKHFSQFTEEEAGTESLRNLPKATQLLSNRSMVHRWVVGLRGPWLFAPTFCHPVF